jgi:hypothetical protein
MPAESPERQLRSYLPGPTPSGWSLASNSIVKRDDGALVVAYSGYGLVVTIESKERKGHRGRRDHAITVERRGGAVTASDLERVVDGLYRRNGWRKQLHEMSQDHPGLGKAVVKFLFAL